MKRIHFIYLTLFMVVGYAGIGFSEDVNIRTIELSSHEDGIRILDQSQEGLELSFGINELQSFDVETKQGVFSHIVCPGMSYSTRIGEPKLPVLRRIISVPLGATVNARIVSSSTQEIILEDMNITHPIIPAQPSLSKSDNPENVPFRYDEYAYTRSGFGERSVIHVEELGILRGLRLFMLMIEPVRYDPAAGLLEIANDITISVSFDGSDHNATARLRATSFSPEFEAVYQRAILNYVPTDSKDDLTQYPVKYVIVSDPMFEAQLQPFIEWKTQQGYEMFVGYVGDPDVGTTTNSIKSYIQNIYDTENPKPTYLLLVGDTGQVPVWSGNTGSHITDLHYVRLQGTDYMPEMYYGRFSAQNTAQLQPQIDKTLEYEKYLMSDPSFLGEVVMIAGMDAIHAATYGNGQINYGTTYYFNAAHGITSHTYLYPNSGSQDDQIVQDVSNGVGYANYTAHGSSTSWSDPSFTISDINSLQNASEYPTVVGNCCLTNSFGTSTCFGEAWLRAEDKGAIGYIGGTNSTYWDEDFWWGVGAGSISSNPTYESHGPGAYDGMFHDHGEPFAEWYTTQYAFIMAGNLAVVEGGGSVNYYWEIYSLMGDPSLSTYFSVPSTNSVSFPAAILIGVGSIDVTAEQYSYVGLSRDGDLVASGLVDTRGEITLAFDPFTTPGEADLVITRQNREPVITTIDIIPNDGPYVVVDSTLVDDGFGGNGNTAFDVGENVDLSVFLRNVGSETAYSVTGSLSSTHPSLAIAGNPQSYGDMASDQIGGPTVPFDVSLGSVSDGTVLPFTIEITSGDSTWIGSFSETARAPVLAQSGWSIDDTAGGNGNGRPDAGETVDLTIVIHNSGTGDANDVTVTFDDSDPYVTITDPGPHTVGAIASGGNAVVPVVSVSFDATCPEAYAAPIPLSFSSNDGYYSETDELTLIVGQRDLLYVDSDNENTETRITTALNAWSGSYTRWNTYETGNGVVPIDTLRAYRMVLWASADQNTSSITSGNQTNLATYLDEGGALLFSGENYLSTYGSADFTSDYLHVANYTTSISGNQITGESGDPVGDGVTLTLSYPSGLAEYPDEIVPDAEAAVVFRMQSSADPVVIRYPESGSSTYRTMFFGVPLEAFPEASSARNNIGLVIERSLAWLGGTGDFIPPEMPQDVVLSGNGTLTWSAASDNVGVQEYHIFRSTSAYFDIDGMSPMTTTADTTHAFPGSVGNPDSNYYFRIIAVDAADNESAPTVPVGEHDYQMAD